MPFIITHEIMPLGFIFVFTIVLLRCALCGRAVLFCAMLCEVFQPQPAGLCLPSPSSTRQPPPTFRARAGVVWCWELRACSALGLGVLAGSSPPTCAQPLRSTNCATPSGYLIRPPLFALHFGRWLSSLLASPAFAPLAGAGGAVGVCAFLCSAVRAVSHVRYVKLHL